MLAKMVPLAQAEVKQFAELGDRVRKARLRRGLSAEELSAQAGISRMTLHRLERGEPTLTVATLLRVMGALGVTEDLALLLKYDEVGHGAQDNRLPRRRFPVRIKLARYPQLKQAAWHIVDPNAELTRQEAFSLYEKNWRHIDQQAMPPAEIALLEQLKATVGKGVMLV